MQRRTYLFILGGLMAIWLTGCQPKEEPPVAGTTPAASGTAGGSPMGGSKAGLTPSAAPTAGANPGYNGPAMGSKSK